MKNPKTGIHKLLLGTLLTTGGASLLVGGVLLGHAPGTATGAPASQVANPPLTVAGEVPYTPSKYPGVMVRHVPTAAATGGTRKGWIYLKPGAKRSALTGRYGTRSRHVWYEAGKTSAGGTIAHVDPGAYPYAVAKVKHDGKTRSHIEIKY